MKILHNYVTKQLLISFLFSLIVFTFILFLGNILRMVELIIRGVGGMILLKFAGYIIPSILTHSIAMALLVSILIIFGRLSVDNELTAMRSSGIRMSKIAFPIIAISVLLSIVCLFLNNVAQPKCHLGLKMLKNQIGIKEPASLIKSGTFIDEFPPYLIYIGEKKGNKFKDIVIHEIKPNNSISFIHAKRGELTGNPDTQDLTLRLYDGTLEEPSSSGFRQYIRGNFDAYIVSLSDRNVSGPHGVKKSTKDKTTYELAGERMLFKQKLKIAGLSEKERTFIIKRISSLDTSIHERLSFALACIAFALIGIPLGIKSHRKEKSIGIAIALALVFIHYGFVLVSKAIETSPQYHPWLIAELPNILLGAIGLFLLYKVSRT